MTEVGKRLIQAAKEAREIARNPHAHAKAVAEAKARLAKISTEYLQARGNE